MVSADCNNLSVLVLAYDSFRNIPTPQVVLQQTVHAFPCTASSMGFSITDPVRRFRSWRRAHQEELNLFGAAGTPACSQISGRR